MPLDIVNEQKPAQGWSASGGEVLKMDIDHQKFLFEQFTFLRPKGGDATPLTERGIECGDGWLGLLVRLCSRIKSLKMRNFKVTQIKEKLGTLCFYYEGVPKKKSKKITEFVSDATEESSHTCEICGAPGRLKKFKWLILTRCHSCKEE